MDDIKIDSYIEIEEGMFGIPVYPLIIDNNVIFGVNQSKLFVNDGRSNRGSIVSFDMKSKSINWVANLTMGENNEIQSKFAVCNDELFVVTKSCLYKLNINNGDIVKSRKIKLFVPHITAIDSKIYLSIKGTINEIDSKTLKTINKVSAKVKWFDSNIHKCNNRYFVSTSNAKVVEFSINDLSILNEFKITGKWAIGTDPIFYENKMIINNYGSKRVVFDLEQNEKVKSFSKSTGSKPLQLAVVKESCLLMQGLMLSSVTT